MEEHGSAVLEQSEQAQEPGVRRRLGRGLQALLGGSGRPEGEEHAAPSPPAAETDVHVDAVDRNPFQPRKDFDQGALDELAESIRQHGVLQSLLVRPVNGRFQLIAGERRWLAAKIAGLTHVPCRVVELEDSSVAEAALEENVKRRDLNALEKAQAFQDYLDRFGCTVEDLSGRLGTSRSAVSNFLRLLNLPDEVKDALWNDEIKFGHARSLLGLAPEAMVEACRRVVREELSVRQTESLVRELATEDVSTEGGDGFVEDQPPEADADENAEHASEQPEEPVDNHVLSLQQSLCEHFGTPVEIKQTGAETGRFVIPFRSNDEFERLLHMLRNAS